MTYDDSCVLDLAGEWRIRADPDDLGLRKSWQSNETQTDWEPASLPAAFQCALGHAFHGIAWMRRRIRLPADWSGNGRLWLCFESVATDCTAWVNGVEVGRHIGDWLPFQFEATSAVAEAEELEIVLRIDEIPAPPPARVGDLQNGHITKGFHDVVSMHHGGLWQPLFLKRTGALAIRPDGVWAGVDGESGGVRATVELIEPAVTVGELEVQIHDGSGLCARAIAPIVAGESEVALELHVEDHHRWSPTAPHLYRLTAFVRSSGLQVPSDRESVSFGFRTLRTGGPGNTRILLNDAPIMIRGVLHWGHEPKSIAPAPSREQVVEEFTRLKAMGFNAICLCMWYPPRWYFDLADEMGMLVWQEHPVWQSPMRDEDVPEYQRLFAGFFRRDRNHPSVAIVSATCEHPCFHPTLAEWWWNEARRQLPCTVLQLQTAFFKWADHARTDLYDEHTYDNSNRWVHYLEDVQHELARLQGPPKPFAMGETIAYTSWPDVAGLSAANGSAPWWCPRPLEHMRELESHWLARYGDRIVVRFREQSRRHHLLGRKFQVEQFRNYANHAAIVMNHLRDVPQCQCGFRDDLGRWRFEAEECSGWLGDVSLLLRTPDQRRAFSGNGGSLPCEVAIANFGDHHLDHTIKVDVRFDEPTRERCSLSLPARSQRGEIARMPITLPAPLVDHPTRMRVQLEIEGINRNAWDLFLFPNPDMRWSNAVVRLDGLPYSPEDSQPDEVERGYSRGYGLAVRNWICELPDPARLLPEVDAWRSEQPLPATTRVVIAHRLTAAMIEFMRRGGRVILFASKAVGGLGTSYEWLFGQTPLIVEEGPIMRGDSEWLLDLLDYDLVRRYARVIPVETLGIADQVDPLIRLCYTHDQSRVKFFDQVFMTQVGTEGGLLVVSSLDHSDDPGRFLLAQMVDFALRDDALAQSEIDPELLRRLAIA